MVTQELLTYIQSSLNAGQKADDITATLVTQGWAGEDVLLAFHQLGIQVSNYNNQNLPRVIGKFGAVLSKKILLLLQIAYVIGILSYTFLFLIVGFIAFESLTKPVYTPINETLLIVAISLYALALAFFYVSAILFKRWGYYLAIVAAGLSATSDLFGIPYSGVVISGFILLTLFRDDIRVLYGKIPIKNRILKIAVPILILIIMYAFNTYVGKFIKVPQIFKAPQNENQTHFPLLHLSASLKPTGKFNQYGNIWYVEITNTDHIYSAKNIVVTVHTNDGVKSFTVKDTVPANQTNTFPVPGKLINNGSFVVTGVSVTAADIASTTSSKQSSSSPGGFSVVTDCGYENAFLGVPGSGTPYTIKHPALDCFINSAKNCTDAKIKYSASLNLFGNVESTMYYSINKKSDNNCNLHNKQGVLTFSAPSGIPPGQAKSSEEYMRNYYKTLIGTEGDCVFTDPNDIAQVFEKWKSGTFTNTDFVKGKCTGKYWDAMGGNPTPIPTSTAMLTPLGALAKAENFFVGVTKVVVNPQTTGDSPSPGMQYLEVDVTVTNNGTTETALPGSFYYQTLSGQELTTADTFGTNAPGKNVQIVGKESLAADFLKPGQTDAAKALIFQIPNGDKGEMIWHQDGFSTTSPKLAIFILF